MACVALLVAFTWSCSGGSGGPTTSPTPVAPTGPNAYGFELARVQGSRWFESGLYFYEVDYLIQRPPIGAVYRILDVTVFGPANEVLPGYTGDELNRSFSMGSGGSPANGYVSVTGNNSAGHPYGERVLVRLEVDQNRSRTVVAAEHFVIHPPQTARLLEFSTSPVMGVDLLTPPYPMVRPPVTVRWNAMLASRVILTTSLNITPNDGTAGQLLVEIVEHAGSRVFPTPRAGGHLVTLQIDDVIKKTLRLVVP